MSWNGTERRAEVIRSKFCDQHINLATDLAVIKECAKNIEQKMTESTTFKNGIVISLVSMGIVLVMELATFAYFYGQMAKQIEINTRRLNIVEQIHRP